MALGKDNPHNWGRGAQGAALRLLLADRKAAYKLVPHKHNKKVMDLMVAPSDGKITLAFTTIATVEHVGNRDWRSSSAVTGAPFANAESQTDIVRKTIAQRWM